MTEPLQPDLYKDRRLTTALLDIANCRRVLRESGDPHSWLDAWRLHRARVAAHSWLHWTGHRD